jgi:polyketide synthase PksN
MKQENQSQEGGNFLLNVRNLTVPFGLLLAERGLKKLIESNSKKAPTKASEKKTTTKPKSSKKVSEKKTTTKPKSSKKVSEKKTTKKK